MVFFEDFDAIVKAKELIGKAESTGIRSFDSSIYNLYKYILMARQTTPRCHSFWPLVESSIQSAMDYYQDKNWTWEYPELQEATASMKNMISAGCMKPERCRSCYFLAMAAGCSGDDLCLVWAMNGALESFKGTILHKRVELYMQELAAWQLEQGRSHVTLGEMLSTPALVARVRSASAMDAAVSSVAVHTRSDMWNHPATQHYLADAMVNPNPVEFLQLEHWLTSNPKLSPFRSEWSIFDEHAQVAGQVDSLWFDEAANSAVIMADWKRAWKTSRRRTHATAFSS